MTLLDIGKDWVLIEDWNHNPEKLDMIEFYNMKV